VLFFLVMNARVLVTGCVCWLIPVEADAATAGKRMSSATRLSEVAHANEVHGNECICIHETTYKWKSLINNCVAVKYLRLLQVCLISHRSFWTAAAAGTAAELFAAVVLSVAAAAVDLWRVLLLFLSKHKQVLATPLSVSHSRKYECCTIQRNQTIWKSCRHEEYMHVDGRAMGTLKLLKLFLIM